MQGGIKPRERSEESSIILVASSNLKARKRSAAGCLGSLHILLPHTHFGSQQRTFAFCDTIAIIFAFSRTSYMQCPLLKALPGNDGDDWRKPSPLSPAAIATEEIIVIAAAAVTQNIIPAKEGERRQMISG